MRTPYKNRFGHASTLKVGFRYHLNKSIKVDMRPLLFSLCAHLPYRVKKTTQIWEFCKKGEIMVRTDTLLIERRVRVSCALGRDALLKDGWKLMQLSCVLLCWAILKRCHMKVDRLSDFLRCNYISTWSLSGLKNAGSNILIISAKMIWNGLSCILLWYSLHKYKNCEDGAHREDGVLRAACLRKRKCLRALRLRARKQK